MGQATVDLPDPLSNPNPAPTNSADDLLAQLAGDEIDRLLAESDVDKTDGKAEAPVASSEPVIEDRRKSEAPATEASIDAVLTPLEEKPSEVPPPVDTPIPTPPTVEPEPVASTTPNVLEIGHAERAALHADESSKSEMSRELDLGGTELPIVFKPLIWLNAPLDACPDAVREAFGKIAIVTLLNAIAVLAYVLIFRRHH